MLKLCRLAVVHRVCVQMLFSWYSWTVLVFSCRSCQPHLRSLGLEVHFSPAADLKVFVGKVPLCFMEKESNELRRGRPSVIKPIAEVKLFTVSLFLLSEAFTKLFSDMYHLILSDRSIFESRLR